MAAVAASGPGPALDPAGIGDPECSTATGTPAFSAEPAAERPGGEWPPDQWD